MPEILTDLSASALALAVEANLYALFESFTPMWGVEMRQTSDSMSYRAQGILSPMFNGVARCHFSPTRPETNIDELIAYFKNQQIPYWFWWLGPTTQPRDLGKYLEQRGFIPYEIDAPGMAVDLQTLPEQLSTPPDFRVTRVRDEAALNTWAQTFITAFEVPEFAGQSWVDASLRFGIDQTPWQLYIGWLGDEPVAVSMLFLGAGVAGILALATIPSARGQGIGAAMTLMPLYEARSLGYRAGVLFSTDMGLNLYRKLGFQQYCTITRYLWRE